ncbi:DUF3164 family protein [Nodularia spumigena]|jgi:hypothetical protein|uniref:DUF3164 family protein n=1 Tax=Nodularia spumigena TaxID=70799 RepID=UPI00232ABCC1|nr:DUF3164 family protein [Nodularia spumigena]MDB9500043.1 DUF3164 family protein [Nodularia spumigena CS-336/02]
MAETTKPITEMSTKELEQFLAAKKKAEANERKRKAAEYAETKERIIDQLVNAAIIQQTALQQFKAEALEKMKEVSQRMAEFGKLNGEWKGNFEIMNDAQTMKIVFKNQVRKSFNELAMMAENHLRDFLKSFVKARNKEAYDFISSILERNSKGDYDINLISRLYKMEDQYEHPSWKEAIRLFKEAYQPVDTKYYINFYTRTESGKWHHVTLDFAALDE